MATFEEVYSLWFESALTNRVKVAVIVAAASIWSEDVGTPNHANRLIWAREAFENPSSKADPMYRVILAVNKELSKPAILEATDASILANVDALVDLFATG